MTDRTRAVRGDRVECPKCHRRIGYWPDRMNYHVAHIMPHRERIGLYGRPAGEWCPGDWVAG